MVIAATAAVVAKVAVDWYKGGDHERRIERLEEWREEHSREFNRFRGRFDKAEE